MCCRHSSKLLQSYFSRQNLINRLALIRYCFRVLLYLTFCRFSMTCFVIVCVMLGFRCLFLLPIFNIPSIWKYGKVSKALFLPVVGCRARQQLQRDILSSLLEILLRTFGTSGYTSVLRLYNRYASLFSISSFCLLQSYFSAYNMKDTLPTQPKKFISFWQKKKTAKCVFFANYSQFSYAIFASYSLSATESQSAIAWFPVSLISQR